jgi:hypothetical protein
MGEIISLLPKLDDWKEIACLGAGASYLVVFINKRNGNVKLEPHIPGTNTYPSMILDNITTAQLVEAIEKARKEL